MELFTNLIANGIFTLIIWSIVVLVLIWFFIRSAVRSGVKHAYFDILEIKEKQAKHHTDLFHEPKKEH